MTVVRRAAPLLKDAVLLELALYKALLRWLLRRPDVPAGSTPVGYSRLAGPMIWLWIFGSAVEVVVLDVVLHRWLPWLRMPLLVVGIWGLLWMLGLLASYRVRPHLLTDTVLRVRNGGRTEVVVPLEAVESVRTVEHELPGVIKAVHVEDDLLLVGVSSRTNLELTMREPTALRLPHGTVTVSRVGLWVDEPREVAARLRVRRPQTPRR
ncbi:hypothetical protein DDE18_00365 [Nocardioides gansuensis]|uniref:DUF304 domain-containing protein n=1 Tax=Nocardioides gansuensis TaxID=2138300 RepID=A0A2T8FEL4_9ACTN|nr:hypothetical protein [Nocardioides gansuensis]PVG84135.1 hypothetical protein DDE18_00365 [Nocardioides gansuensis]